MERLTVREHLELFGRIKNVEEKQLNKFVTSIMYDMNLQAYENKLAQVLLAPETCCPPADSSLRNASDLFLPLFSMPVQTDASSLRD